MLKPEEIQAGKWYLIREGGILEIALTYLGGSFTTRVLVNLPAISTVFEVSEVEWIKELDLKKLEEEG